MIVGIHSRRMQIPIDDFSSDASLSSAEYALIIDHLYKCLAVFEKKKGPLLVAEMQVKSTVATLLNELRRHRRKR